MKTTVPFVVTSVFVALACVYSAQGQSLSEQEIAKIQAGLPAKAAAQPAKPRKLLVFSASRMKTGTGTATNSGLDRATVEAVAEPVPVFISPGQAAAAIAIAKMGAATGAFEATVTSDISFFEPEKLNTFDAVCLNNCVGELFLPPDFQKMPEAQRVAAAERQAALKKSLLAFLAGGKGLVGIGATVEAFPDWPEFGLVLGGAADGVLWDAKTASTIAVDDPEHPVCAGLGEKFPIRDDVAQLKWPYYRMFARMLLTLDTSADNVNRPGINRTGGDFALSWIKTDGQKTRQGRGRVFCTILGRSAEAWTNPALARHCLAGIQFALGDLPASTQSIPGRVAEQKMAAACPKVFVKPARPRKLLVFRRYGHAYGHYISKALEIMGRQTGAFEAVVRDDVEAFEPQNLAQFDAVFMNNSTDRDLNPQAAASGARNIPDTERQTALRKNLLEFVRNGKGIAGVHVAAGGSPEFVEMIGGCFESHPWEQKVWIRPYDPSSPLTKNLPAEGFEVREEVYQFKEPYGAGIHILTVVDLARTVKPHYAEGDPLSWLNHSHPTRKDNVYATSWIKPYGKGRVFYATFGHTIGLATDPNILQIYLDGIQYALGDLPADATGNFKPSNEKPRIIPAPSVSQPAEK
ncbi:MAG: ThuA domain-containing protein [Thermoguttaceae bacterium]